MLKLSRSELVGMDLVGLNKELKRVASLKCNLKKRKGVVDKEKELVEILSYEDMVKEVKNGKLNKGKSYFEFEKEDIDKLEIDELVRFRKGVSSKKCLDGGDSEILEKCEELLKYSKEVLDDKRNREEKELIKKSEICKLLENYKMGGDVKILIEKLEEMVE